MSWYGNGPAPTKHFYGTLPGSEDEAWSRLIAEQQRKARMRREEALLKRYPTLAAIEEEVKHAEDDLRHREIALDNLRDERDIIRKLLGADE